MKSLFVITVLVFSFVFISGNDYWGNAGNSYEINSNGDSLNCRLLGRPLFGECKSVTASGSIAYGGFGYSLLVFDMTDPANPIMIDYVEFGKTPTDIVIQDTFVYVGLWAYGLKVYNIADPYNVFLADTFYNNKYVNDINILDTLLVIAEDNASITVINIKDPTDLKKVAAFTTETASHEAWLVNDTLVFSAEAASGLKIYDISDTLAIANIGTYNTAGSARGVTVKNSIAYVSDFTGGVAVLNIADPTLPILLNIYNDPGTAYTMSIEDTIAFLTDDIGGVRVLNAAHPEDSLYEIGFYDDNSVIRLISHVGSYIYASDMYEGLLVIKASDLTSLSLAGQHDEGNSVAKLCAADTMLYAVMGSEGFAIINVKDAENAFMAGEFDSTGTTGDMKVVGQYAYVANSTFGLQIINISNPQNPFTVSTVNTGNFPRAVEVVDSFVYIACDTGGLKIINAANPLSPLLIGSCNTPGKAMGLFIRDTLVYVADFDSGMSIINIANKTAPVRIGGYDNPTGFAYNVAVYDTFAILADHFVGFRIYSIKNPANPVLLNTQYTIGSALDVIIDWPLLYVAEDIYGLRIFNILNPSDPKEIGYYDTYGQATGLDFQDSTVYCAENFAGITLLNYTKPLTFSLSGTVGLDQNPADSSGTLVRGIEFAQSCSTDASGNYQFADMLEGTYTLIFEHAGYHPDTVTAVFTGYETFNTTLDYIELYAMLGNIGLLDNPVDSSESYLWIDELSVGDSTNSAGDFYFAAIPAGDYTLIASHEGYWPDTIDAVFTGTERFNTDLSVCDTTPPSAFSLISPKGDLYNDMPTYCWHPSSDTHFMNYELYVFDSLVATVTDTEYIELSPLADGKYRWHVIASDSFLNTRESSGEDTFTLDLTKPSTPVLSSPANGAYTSASTMTWHSATDNLSGVIFYEIMIDDDSLFGSSWLDNVNDTTCDYSSITEQRWFWRVRAFDSFDNEGDWSNVWSFEFDSAAPSAPVLVYPANNAELSDISVFFDWQTVTKKVTAIKLKDNEAKSAPVNYIIQIDTAADFSAPLNDDTFALDTARYILAEGDIYFWRVMAYDEALNYGVWSDADSFGIDMSYPSSPSLVFPTENSITNNSIFMWRSSTDNYSGVQYYDLLYDDDSLFASPETIATADTSYTASMSDNRYFWQVRAIDNYDNTGPWSADWVFDYDATPPSTPSLVSPLDNSSTTDSTFAWHSSTDNFIGVKEYMLWYDDDSLFGSPNTTTTAETTYTASLSDFVYYWRVRASDNADNTGDWSDVWSFDFSPAGIADKYLLDTKEKLNTKLVVSFNAISYTAISAENEFVIYDITGKQIYASSMKRTGQNTYNTDNLSSGVYFVRLRDSKTEINKKIVIIR